MALPPPNLPTPPFDGASTFAGPVTGKVPGAGADAPDPCGVGERNPGLPRVPQSVRAAPPAEDAPLAPPAFRQPRPPARGRRTVMLIISSVLVLALLAVVAVVAARLLFSGAGSTDEPSPSPAATSTFLSESSLPAGSATPTTDAAAQVADGDQDGLTNAEEAFYRTKPDVADTDDDGFTDSQEVRAGYDPLGPGKLDSDNDDFPDPDEKEFGSDPFNPDTDGDGYNDGAEIKNGYNPLIPSPGDKL